MTLIEAYEDQPVIQRAEALGADRLRVTLADGRVQEITIRGLGGSDEEVGVALTESQAGVTIRTETT